MLEFFKSLTKNWPKFRIKNLNIDNFIKDITKFNQSVFKRFTESLTTCKFSQDLKNIFIENSKMENWPEKFNTIEKLRENKKDFLNINCKLKN